MNKKYIAYGIMAVMTANGIIEIIRPNSLPQDTPNNNVVLHGVSDSNIGSAFGIVGRWPTTVLMSTPQLDNYGYSYYEVKFREKYLPNQDNIGERI